MEEAPRTKAGATLWEALGSVPDHRRAEGKRYPLASLLLIAIAAMLAGRRDQLGIVRWGRKLSAETLAAIGIERSRVPAPSVWCELFRDLNIVALEQALGVWVRGDKPADHVAIDGKRLRGSATATSPGAHLLVDEQVEVVDQAVLVALGCEPGRTGKESSFRSLTFNFPASFVIWGMLEKRGRC